MEAEPLFHHEIVSKVEKYKIPYSMIWNMDQTLSKCAPVSTRDLAEKNSEHVSISGSPDK